MENVGHAKYSAPWRGQWRDYGGELRSQVTCFPRHAGRRVAAQSLVLRTLDIEADTNRLLTRAYCRYALLLKDDWLVRVTTGKKLDSCGKHPCVPHNERCHMHISVHSVRAPRRKPYISRLEKALENRTWAIIALEAVGTCCHCASGTVADLVQSYLSSPPRQM